MKASEFRKLIREEVRKIVKEVGAKNVKVEIGPFSNTAGARNSKLEPVVKSFIKNAKQEKGAHASYWLVGIFDKNAFNTAKEKYSLTLEKGNGRFTIKYKNNELVLRPEEFLSDKELGNLVGYTGMEKIEPDNSGWITILTGSDFTANDWQFAGYKGLIMQYPIFKKLPADYVKSMITKLSRVSGNSLNALETGLINAFNKAGIIVKSEESEDEAIVLKVKK